MKIRQAFVANSSSVSFCIYGFWSDDSKIFDKVYSMEKELYDHGFEKFSPPWGYTDVYVGMSLTQIGEDETLRQFKERTSIDLNKLFPQITDFSIQQDGWYDG